MADDPIIAQIRIETPRPIADPKAIIVETDEEGQPRTGGYRVMLIEREIDGDPREIEQTWWLELAGDNADRAGGLPYADADRAEAWIVFGAGLASGQFKATGP